MSLRQIFAEHVTAFVEIGGNRLLALDDDVMQQCAVLQGHCIAVELTDIAMTWYCHPGSWGIRLSLQPPPQEVDATISGRLFALLDLALEDDKISTAMRERVSIQGDAGIARKMQKIITSIDIDWEETLSHYTGDVLAFQITQQARQAAQSFKQNLDSLLQTSSEYLCEEVRLTPTQAEFTRFQQQVTAIKYDVDRSAARLQQLCKSLQDKAQ